MGGAWAGERGCMVRIVGPAARAFLEERLQPRALLAGTIKSSRLKPLLQGRIRTGRRRWLRRFSWVRPSLTRSFSRPSFLPRFSSWPFLSPFLPWPFFPAVFLPLVWKVVFSGKGVLVRVVFGGGG